MSFGLSDCTPSAPPHPLEDRIFDTTSGRELAFEEIEARLDAAEVIYLGEAHGEPAHRAVEAAIVHSLIVAGRRPALGLETFAVGQTSILQEYLHRTGDAEEWLHEASGWDLSSYYGDVLRLAHAAKLELFGIDLDRWLRRRLIAVGIEGLTALERNQLSPGISPDGIYRELMLEWLAAWHCRDDDTSVVARLYETWTARNDTMASAIVAILKSDPTRPVVAILGAAHTNYGMGVMQQVDHLRPATRQLNIGLRGVVSDMTQVTEYYHYGHDPARAAAYPPSHEILWFTRSSVQRPTIEESCGQPFAALEELEIIAH